MHELVIHPQLQSDCHILGTLASGSLLLSRNALLPWFILVPATALTDVLDLAVTDRQRVMDDCAAVSAFIKQELAYPKVNFAGLGNVVPQMHLHIVGRKEGDDCWPQPIWGNLPAGPGYDEDTLERWGSVMADQFGLERE